MTLILSTASKDMITVSVDSTESKFYEKGEVDYIPVSKVVPLNGVGIVGAWGNRDGMRIGEYIRQKNITGDTHNIESLLEIVRAYLHEDYQPHKRGGGRVGFHVGGFDDTKPILRHIYYDPDEGYKESIHDYEQQPTLLYNGRHETVNAFLRLIEDERVQHGEPGLNLLYSTERIIFAQRALQFASSVTRQVGPPFRHFFLFPYHDRVERLDSEKGADLDTHAVCLMSRFRTGESSAQEWISATDVIIKPESGRHSYQPTFGTAVAIMPSINPHGNLDY